MVKRGQSRCMICDKVMKTSSGVWSTYGNRPASQYRELICASCARKKGKKPIDPFEKLF